MSEDKDGKVIELFRRAPADTVLRLRREWVTGLIRLIYGTNDNEAGKAIRELVKVTSFDAAPILTRAMAAAPTVYAREVAACELQAFDTDEVLEELTRCALQDEEIRVALGAARSLSVLQRFPTTRKRFALLMVRVRSRHATVRLEVVTRLLLAADKDAPKIAAWALTDEDGRVRKLAKHWLLNADRDDVVGALLRVRKMLRGNLRIQHLTAEIIRARWPEIEIT